MKPNPITHVLESGAGSLGRWRAEGKGLDLGTTQCSPFSDKDHE
jgi:hypothetical protein